MPKKSSSYIENEETSTEKSVQESAGATGTTATVETSESTEPAEGVNSGSTGMTSESKESATVESEPKYGLVRFLQINPLLAYEESLLKAMYRSDVMTKSDWLEKLNAILNKKVR